MSNYKTSVDNVYKEISNLIILGLTGRTGSGCTTTANILNTKKFDDLNLVSPKERDFLNKEERKDAIVYKFMKNKWEPFTIIDASGIILSFVLEQEFNDFRDYITKISEFNETSKIRISGEAELLKNINGFRSLFENGYKIDYNNIDTILNNREEIEKYYTYYTVTIRKIKRRFYSLIKDYC